MVAGDVYVSTPALFIHGVEYPEHTAAEPIIAVQCRCFMNSDQFIHSKLVNAEQSAAICAVLREATISLPTLEQVRVMEAILDRKQSSSCICM
jgi:hypothetical protein